MGENKLQQPLNVCSPALTHSQLEVSSTSKTSKVIFNGGRIVNEYAQSMFPGYFFGYPGLFSVLLTTEPHSVKSQEQQSIMIK